MNAEAKEFWSFSEKCSAAATAADIGRIFAAEMEKLEFSSFTLCSLVDLANPPAEAVLFSRVSEAWLEHYKERAYHRINPVHQESLLRVTPFRWTDPEFRSRLQPVQVDYMHEVAEACEGDGVTFGLRSKGALPATCSFTGPPGAIRGRHFMLAHSIAVVAHESARRLLHAAPYDPAIIQLSPRERDCLTYAARGKSDWAISEMIGLSETAAHKIIERVKRKFGVATRVQAVVQAIHAGQLLLSDAIG
jgi:DNA-binding CsgD family transcriptional regulator